MLVQNFSLFGSSLGLVIVGAIAVLWQVHRSKTNPSVVAIPVKVREDR